ncbi:archaetidylinositol phosphate synthase [Methanohalophilus levihalophilus]|uniref:CDP-alcohol phosphatidyltransferase family protein n=1 Tax=Methanohalophilus levihalophilus TaxID=1431282 RepID=UPI001FD99FB4|nr:CDP-alcohol phosphatidyltransferase family protein [Methanohalophilus levihalophilus]MBP2029762.1 archaetidylinositol phosphate synthase [Methanohalophilus levihalophilus]
MSPNTLTVLGLVVSAIAAFMFARGSMILGGVLLLLSGIFDVFDGAVARASNFTTRFGGVLDSVCDRYADALIFAGIIYGLISGNMVQSPLLGIDVWLWAMFAMIGSFLVSYTRARAEAAGSGVLNVGIAERSERMILLIIAAFTGFLGPILAFIALITHVTLLQRIISAKERL